MLEYLTTLHLQPGALIVICTIAPFDGPLLIEIDGERVPLARELAATLLVERLEEAA